MEAFSTYPTTEWVWWLDVDAIIMTPHLDLYKHLLDHEVLRSRLSKDEIIVPNERIPMLAHESLRTGEVESQIFID
jgi:hypothetical protein